jgi:hypothetical protein
LNLQEVRSELDPGASRCRVSRGYRGKSGTVWDERRNVTKLNIVGPVALRMAFIGTQQTKILRS